MSLISSALSLARTASMEGSSGASGKDLSVTELSISVRDLQRQVAKLTSMNLALFEILKERTGITEQELIARIELLEQKPQDTASQADGQTPQAGATCELCGKTYSKRNNRCLYCGHINTRTSIL